MNCLSHESFHIENLNTVKHILNLNHYSRGLIKKLIKVRIQQIKGKKNNSMQCQFQNGKKIFISVNTVVLLYFVQILKTFQSMLIKFNFLTIFAVPL